MQNLLAGIDIGTTGLKVALYTFTGKLVYRAYREYALSLPKNGWVEINSDIWWQKLCECLTEIRDSGKVSLANVAGIGITCTNSLLLLDGNQKALMPAIMQLDQRAAEQAESMINRYGQDWVFNKTGNRVSAGAFWGPTLQWIREKAPSVYEQARYFLVPTSYLVLRLTGMYTIDHSRAASTMLYNIHQGNWDEELCNAVGLSKNLLPPIYKSQDVVGYVTNESAVATGFSIGTPVIAGAMDSIGALVGLGAGPNNGALIMGSVGRLCIESQHLDVRFMNTVNADASNRLIMTPVNSTGVSYKWLKNLLFSDNPEQGHIYQKMDKMAATVSPGSEGLVYLPYLTGERSPIWDPHSSGGFMGLQIKHQRPHFVRAVLEGVGFALAHNFEILKNELQIDPPYLFAGGGGATSRIWMQIICDMIAKPLYIPEELETETMGAAMLTGVGIGIFSNLSTIQKSWIQFSVKVLPREPVSDRYEKLLPIFKELYFMNKENLNRYRQLSS